MSERAVIVTGTSRGIGLALAEVLLGEACVRQASDSVSSIASTMGS